jgi:hypothetical protein
MRVNIKEGYTRVQKKPFMHAIIDAYAKTGAKGLVAV